MNMKIKSLASLTFLTVLVIAVSTSFNGSKKPSTAQLQPEIPDAYREALEDAAKPELDEILDNLTVIDPSNPNLKWDQQERVLVANFATENKFKPGKPIPKEIWVTVVPELKEFCTKYKNALAEIHNGQLNEDQLNESVILRLKQVLGLPPNSDYTHIAEIWVEPEYLKRPSLDPEINDSTVQPIPHPIQDPLPFSEGANLAYQSWFKTMLDKRSTSLYPWTGLGYTYDWGIYPKTGLQTDAGLSEFVIFLPIDSEVTSSIEVKQIVSIKEYCKVEE
jgi:hypothetical protein